MAGYTRQRSAEIVNGSTADASDVAAEFNQVEAGFNSVTGHTHDGTSAEGAPITVIGPSQDVVATAALLRPKTHATVDLGTTALRYKDLFLSGTAIVGSLTAPSVTITGGTISGITDLAVADGGTGASTAAGALTNLGLTATAAELNTLDGITATVTELNYTDGVTSAIQTQLNAKQPLDTDLTAIAALSSAANKVPYSTGAGTWALADFTAAGRALVDDADATAQRSTLGLGTIATQNAATVAITGGSISGITDLAIADGGTGASTAAGALTNLGLTATAAELNVLDGITSTVTELNYTDGVTSNIQTQLNAKAALASPALTGTPTAPTAAEGTDTTQIATTAFVLANAPAAAYLAYDVQYFTTSGTWTKPASAVAGDKVFIHGVGGGQAGTGNSINSARRGGAGGKGYQLLLNDINLLAATRPVTIGAGGTGTGAAAGGDTIFGVSGEYGRCTFPGGGSSGSLVVFNPTADASIVMGHFANQEGVETSNSTKSSLYGGGSGGSDAANSASLSGFSGIGGHGGRYNVSAGNFPGGGGGGVNSSSTGAFFAGGDGMLLVICYRDYA